MTQDRRLRLLGLVVLLVFGVAWLRAAQLTTVEAASLRGRLDEGRAPQTVPAPRGTITDRKGIVLAISEPASDIAAIPYLIDEKADAAAKLSAALSLPEDDVLEDLTAGTFVYLKHRASAEETKAVRALGLEGIQIDPRTRRSYPQESVAAQVIGFAGDEGKGLTGVEASLEDTLRGTDGRRVLVHGRGADRPKVVYVEDEQPASPGKSVKLTLDARIQSKAEEVLADTGTQFGARSATAVVMQPSTGEVLALASWPKIDANSPGDAPESARMVEATGFAYEPGSTFKPFTVAGALENREVSPTTTMTVPGQIQVADQVIGEAHARGTEVMTVGDILAESSNVGTIMIGKRLGKTRFDRWIRAFGFGTPTGVEVPAEEQGFLLKPSQYSGSSMGNLPIGQGELVTPMQLASGYATIANDGVRVRPTLVGAVNGQPVERDRGQRIVSAGTATELRAMLKRVTEDGGTGAALHIDGYEIAGKTGTANKVDPVTGEYSKTLYTSSFVGMAPADRPRIVAAVIVDEPSRNGYYGAQVAGPAFRELAKWTLNYLSVPTDANQATN